MSDVEKVARAICAAAGLDPDAVAMVEVKLGREPVRTLRWQVHIPQAEAALAAMGERGAVAVAWVMPGDVRLPPRSVIRKGVRLTTLLVAIQRREGWSEEETAFDASPRPEAVEEDGG